MRTPPTALAPIARIVDEHGTPVAGAEVAFDVSADLLDAQGVLPFDAEARLAAARRFTTGADGTVALPLTTAVAFVIARAGDRFGHGVLEFDDPRLGLPELRIAPDRNLRLVVIGPQGEPRRDVPIEVGYQHREGRVDPGLVTFQLPRSDDQGLVVLWHAQALEFWRGTAPAVELRTVVLGATTPSVRVALGEAGTGPVVVPCPAHGGIRVHTWLAARVENHATAPPTIAEVVGDEEPHGGESMHIPGATPGEWLVYPIALGKHWQVGAPRFAAQRCEGPTHDEQELRLDLTTHEDYRAVSVLLLQADGSPCASQPIELQNYGCEAARRSIVTDTTGRLQFATESREEIESLRLDAPALEAFAVVEIPDAPWDGTRLLDLGVVRLQNNEHEQALPLLAAGRVVEAMTGRPVRAHVVATDADEHQRWDSWTGVDGTFTVRGERADEIQLRVDSLGFAPTTVPVHRGARDLVVALQPATALHVTVLVDPEIAVEALAVLLRDDDQVTTARTTIAQPGRISCWFDPSDYEGLAIEVHGGWFQQPRRHQPTGEGPPPLACIPRQQWRTVGAILGATIDLRGTLEQVSVSVRQLGCEEANGSLHVRAAGSASPWLGVAFAPRLLIAIARGTTLEAIAVPSCGPGCKSRLSPGENTIVIPATSVASIDVQGLPPEVPREDVEVRVWVLVRREPALDELWLRPVMPWPHTLADLRGLRRWHDYDWPQRGHLDEGPASLRLEYRGSYVAVPFVAKGRCTIPFVDAAVPIEISTPGEIVEATIRLDAEKVRAALR